MQEGQACLFFWTTRFIHPPFLEKSLYLKDSSKIINDRATLTQRDNLFLGLGIKINYQ